VIILEPKKMTVYINPEVHTEVKILAAKTGKSMSEISEEALKEYLKRYGK
jgi:predicted HicB family RNase H-like nuclease